MVKSKSSSSRQKLLSHTRPPIAASAASSHTSSSKSTRTTIRSYHTLQKRLAKALSEGDEELATILRSELSASGGLPAYQAASTLGQSAQRGGDTSKVLVEWLQPVLRRRTGEGVREDTLSAAIRVLEVGALSPTNALNVPGRTVVRRIDLRSNGPQIEEQDFMTLSTTEPWRGSVYYDVVSLSLVVNFVGDARQRGRMLQRTTGFLATNTAPGSGVLLPALFLVLPLPCVDNSRYLTEDRLLDMMKSLGYHQLQVKRTSKLYYSLWRFDAIKHKNQKEACAVFKKSELRSGKDRNNFCVVLDGAYNS